ncbi:MAG TPA: carbon starvation CstA family protein, partial [Candidatus Ratteibacteria bacterium]|nr:carbon starvation CstA family protein [Candidatus Ratteibacteria bacterium]
MLFLIAYAFYGRYLEKLWEVNPDEKTPAYKKEDGVNYAPVKHWS